MISFKEWFEEKGNYWGGLDVIDLVNYINEREKDLLLQLEESQVRAADFHSDLSGMKKKYSELLSKYEELNQKYLNLEYEKTVKPVCKLSDALDSSNNRVKELENQLNNVLDCLKKNMETIEYLGDLLKLLTKEPKEKTSAFLDTRIIFKSPEEPNNLSTARYDLTLHYKDNIITIFEGVPSIFANFMASLDEFDTCFRIGYKGKTFWVDKKTKKVIHHNDL